MKNFIRDINYMKNKKYYNYRSNLQVGMIEYHTHGVIFTFLCICFSRCTIHYVTSIYLDRTRNRENTVKLCIKPLSCSSAYWKMIHKNISCYGCFVFFSHTLHYI